MMERQLPLGAVPMAFGIMTLAARLNYRHVPGARLGREQALSIYIIHPFFLKIGSILLGKLGLAGDVGAFATIIFAFVVSVIVCLALDAIWPAAANLLRGRLPALEAGK